MISGRHILILFFLCGFIFSKAQTPQIPKSNPYPDYIDTAKINQLNKKNREDYDRKKQLQLDSLKEISGDTNALKDSSQWRGKLKHRFLLKDSTMQHNRDRRSRDSLKMLMAEKNKNLKDGLKSKYSKNKKEFKTVVIKGSLSNQFDYGAIPYYMASSSLPAGLFKSNGDFKIKLGKIPLKADYFYANPKSISGLTNYYTIGFDVEEFQKMRNSGYLEKSRKMRDKVDSLEYEKQKLNQKLSLIQMLKSNQEKYRMDKNSLPQYPNVSQIQPNAISDFPTDSLKFLKIDTLNIPLNDSLRKQLIPEDSLRSPYAGIDTSAAQIRNLQKQVGEIERLSTLYKKQINIVEFPESDVSPGSAFPQTGFSKLLEGFKKLEVGMCYPNYSTFMINQMAIKGVNTKYSTKNLFVNASYGKSVINYSVQSTANPLLNQIQGLSTFFDWNKNPDEKNIGSAKIGFGKENGTYLGIGGLFGKGTTSPYSTEIKKNYVFELDGRWIYKFVNFEGAVAKSYIVENTKINSESESFATKQPTNWSKSYQCKLFGVLPKVNTKFSFLYRVVEPYFKSFGVGFMRSDVLRWESKLEQPLGKLVKVGFNYRRDEDNLKKLHSYKTVLENFTYSFKLKLFKRKMDIVLNYTEIVQNTKDILLDQHFGIKSNIKTAVITYTYKRKKLISTNTLMANVYTLKNEHQQNQLQNYSLNSFNQYKKWQLNSLNAYNQSNIKDSLNYTNAINNMLEIGYQISDKMKMIAGGKHAFQTTIKTSQFGYSASLSYVLHKLSSIELKIEKLVIGDFVNTLNYSSIQQFPYYGYLKITSSF